MKWLIFIVPALLLTLGLFFSYMVFGNLFSAVMKMWELKGQPNVTKDAMGSLSIVWTITLTSISIIITAFFSYILWRNNESSLKISNELKQLEENRDFEIKREKALIVYYDLQRGFNILKNLYVERILNKKNQVTKKIFFSENWIENVASLRQDLNTNDINQLYNIYNILFTVKNYLESEDDQQIEQYLIQVSNEIFNNFLPKNLFDKLNNTEIEDFISSENFIIMHKLYKLTFNKNEITEVNNQILINEVRYSMIIDGDINNGECILYNTYGYKKIKGHYFEGVFITEEYYGYNGTNELYKVEYITSSSQKEITKAVLKNLIYPELEGEDLINATYIDGVLSEGKVTEYHDNGKIKFYGNLVNGERNGFCKLFRSNGLIEYEGIVDGFKKVSGKSYSSKGSLLFEGDYNRGLPWNGEAYQYDIDKVKEFTGIIKGRKPFKGTGYHFKKSSESDFNEEEYYNSSQAFWEEQDELSIEERIQIAEEQEEYEKMRLHEYTKENSDSWEEYIFTDWENGNYTEREDNVFNKKVIGYQIKKSN